MLAVAALIKAGADVKQLNMCENCWCGVRSVQCAECERERVALSHAFGCRHGSAAIHKAAEGGHLSCLELLITNNADIDVQDE